MEFDVAKRARDHAHSAHSGIAKPRVCQEKTVTPHYKQLVKYVTLKRGVRAFGPN